MNMTTGDIIAIAAVSLNALVYLSGLFKLNATVDALTNASSKLETIVDKISERLASTELSVASLEANCRIFHGVEAKNDV